MHVCDNYCIQAARRPEHHVSLILTEGAEVPRHIGVRPTDYPPLTGDEWPKDPPFCTTCGHELLTEPVGGVEWHADGGLDPMVPQEI